MSEEVVITINKPEEYPFVLNDNPRGRRGRVKVKIQTPFDSMEEVVEIQRGGSGHWFIKKPLNDYKWWDDVLMEVFRLYWRGEVR